MRAGFIFGHSSMILAVPFDPFAPFCFMGEELSLSVRLWTSGFDIYAPSVDVLRHWYGRHDAVKFWESIAIVYDDAGMHNRLTNLTIQRLMHLASYPEAKTADLVSPADILVQLSKYGLGSQRRLSDFLQMVGLDVWNKTTRTQLWCIEGTEP